MACNSFNKIFCGSICTQQNQKAMLVKYGKSYIRLYHLDYNKYAESDPYINYKIPDRNITNHPRLKKPPSLYQEYFGKQRWHNQKPQTQQYSKGIINQYKEQSNEVESSASKSSFGGTSTRNSGPLMYRKIHNHTSYGLSRIKSLKNTSLQSVKKSAKGMTHQFSAPSKVPYFSFNTQNLIKADSPELTRFKTIRSVKYAPSIEKERKNLRKKLNEGATTSTPRDTYIGRKFFQKELNPEPMQLPDLQIIDKKTKTKQTGFKTHNKYSEMPQSSQTKLVSPTWLGQNAEKHTLQRYLPNPLETPFMNTAQVQSRNFSVKTRPSVKFKLKRDGITEDINQMAVRHQMAHVAFVVSNPHGYERPSRTNSSHR